MKSAAIKMNQALIVVVQFVDPNWNLLISMWMAQNAPRILGKEAFDNVGSKQDPCFVDVNEVAIRTVI